MGGHAATGSAGAGGVVRVVVAGGDACKADCDDCVACKVDDLNCSEARADGRCAPALANFQRAAMLLLLSENAACTRAPLSLVDICVFFNHRVAFCVCHTFHISQR